MKRCIKCKQLLNEDEFHKNTNSKDGLQNRCKKCKRLHYYENHAYYLKRHAEYRAANREQRRENQRCYDAAHKKEKQIRDREWQLQHPEECRARSHRRRARVANLPADLTLEEWEEILEKYNHSCVYCGTKSESLQQEHVIPVAQGGGYTKDNIVPACPRCNQQKGNRIPEEAGMEIKIHTI